MTCPTCTCGSVSTTPGASCCSMHGTLATGIGFRAQISQVGGAVAGFEIPLFTADSGVALFYMANTRLWINHVQMVFTGAGDSLFYHGSTVGDDTTSNAIIAGGPYAANGGVVLTLPWVRTAVGEKLFVKTATAELYRIIVHGIYETV